MCCAFITQTVTDILLKRHAIQQLILNDIIILSLSIELSWTRNVITKRFILLKCIHSNSKFMCVSFCSRLVIATNKSYIFQMFIRGVAQLIRK